MNTPDTPVIPTCDFLIGEASKFDGSCWDAFDKYESGPRGQMIINCRWCLSMNQCKDFQTNWVWASVFVLSYISGLSLLLIGFYLKEKSVFSKHPYPLISRTLMV